MSERLEQLRAEDRARRWLWVGGLGIVAVALWLFLAWRASRVGENVCTVIRMPGGGDCSLRHLVGGEEHLLPWSDCARPRWSREEIPAAVGAELPCHYYVSFPSDVFLEPRQHRWFGPVSIGVLLAALAALAFGIHFSALARRLLAVQAPALAGYRTAASVAVEPKPALSIPLQVRHWSRWIVGGPFLLLGTALVLLSALLVWQTGGDLGVGIALLLVFSLGVTYAGAVAAFHRSGLVFDASQGLFHHWWGLRRPMFFDHHALATLARVSVVVGGTTRRPTHYLTLHLADGKERRYARTSREEAEAEAQRILEYLRLG